MAGTTDETPTGAVRTLPAQNYQESGGSRRSGGGADHPRDLREDETYELETDWIFAQPWLPVGNESEVRQCGLLPRPKRTHPGSLTELEIRRHSLHGIR